MPCVRHRWHCFQYFSKPQIILAYRIYIYILSLDLIVFTFPARVLLSLRVSRLGLEYLE